VVVLLPLCGFCEIVGSNLGEVIIFIFILLFFPCHAKFEFHNIKISNGILGL
jgi:hypothetical protein